MPPANSLRLAALILSLLAASCPATAQVNAVTKWRYDLANTGWNPNETLLTTGSVRAATFGKLWERTVDGQVYAQPLYVANVSIPNKGVHNIVLVATEHNTVYAFDADSAAAPNDQPLWQTNLGPSVPTSTVGCNDLSPEYGITSTPAIDLATLRLFVVPKTLENNKQVWRLHALDIRTGEKINGWGFPITGAVLDKNGTGVLFNPDIQLSRSALVINNGRVYVTFGSHCDIQISMYHGWIFAYNLNNPAEAPQIWNTSPDTGGDGEAANGIWMGGASPAFDASGNLYVITGNGPFNIDLGGRELGDSFAKVATNGGTGFFFSGDPKDYFTPSNQDHLRQVDADLGSGGITLLPNQSGTTTPRLLVGGGKDGYLRLIDRDNFGGFNGRVDPNAPNKMLQEIGGHGNGFWSSPAYWNSNNGQYVYAMGVNDVLKQYQLGVGDNGQSRLTHIASGSTNSGYPSSTPVVSSNGGQAGTGIVWLLNRATRALHAYDAANIATELYNSNQRSDRDAIGPVIKFTVPLVANGRVYVGADRKLIAYGLDPPDASSVHHYVITGPKVVNRNEPVHFQITAQDASNTPVSTTRSVSLKLRKPDGSLVDLGTLQFINQANVIWKLPYGAVGANRFIAARGTGLEATFDFTVKARSASGIDHFKVVVPTKVAIGKPFNYTLIAKNKNNVSVPYTGTVTVTFTRPNGTIATDQPSVTFNNQKSAVGTANLGVRGYRILIATDGEHTGTGVFEVVDKILLTGKAIPGDWVGRDRLRAKIRLLKPGNHTVVVQTSEVILEDDFSFSIEVPLGTYAVAVKVEHWLQQIIKWTMPASGVLFAGPEGNGLLNGDTNNDNKVDSVDLANVQADLGGPPSGTRGATDLNGDAVVDNADLEIVNRHLGRRGDR